MLGQSKFKKDIGFIRHRSSRVIKQTQPQSSSSDDFSSFDCDPDSEREFSPYRQPTILNEKNRKKHMKNQPNIPKYKQNKLEKQLSTGKLGNSKQMQFSNQFLKDKFTGKNSKNEQQIQNLRYNVKNLVSNIEEVTNNFSNVQKRQRAFKRQQQHFQNQLQQYSLGKPKFQQNKHQINTEGSQIYRRHASNQNLTGGIHKKIAFQPNQDNQDRRDPQNSSSSEQFEDYQNQHPKYHQNYPKHTKQYERKRQQEQQQDLITEYDICQFAKKKTIKDEIQGYSPNRQHIKTEQGKYYSTRGGICFQLDVKDFATENKDQNQYKQQAKYVIPQSEKPQRKTSYQPYKLVKKKKVNTKEQILKRRQLARNYDQIARKKVFGCY